MTGWPSEAITAHEKNKYIDLNSKKCRRVAIEKENENACKKNKETRKQKENEVNTDVGKDRDSDDILSAMYEFLPDSSYSFSKSDSIISFYWAVEQILESRSTVFSQPTGYVLNSR